MIQESASACPAGVVLIAAANAPRELGIRHVTKRAAALTVVRVIPRVVNASASAGGLEPRVMYLAQVAGMAKDVDTGESLIS